MAQNYTPEHVQQALAAGLIKPEDAEYLINALGPQNSVAGAVGGALAGGLLGGAAAGWGAQKLGSKLSAPSATGEEAGSFGKWAGTKAVGNEGMLPADMPGGGMLGDLSNAGLTGGGLGALGGGVAGGFGGGMAMASPGQGVGTEDPADMALRILVDPNSSERDKKQAAMYLQSLEQEQGGQGGLGGMLGPGLGGALGAAAGAGGMALGMPALGGWMAKGRAADSTMGKVGNALKEDAGRWSGLAGAALGGADGAMLGSYLDPYTSQQGG